METNQLRSRVGAAPHWYLAACQKVGSSRAEGIKEKWKYSNGAQKWEGV